MLGSWKKADLKSAYRIVDFFCDFGLTDRGVSVGRGVIREVQSVDVELER